jgi:hypothetical protein
MKPDTPAARHKAVLDKLLLALPSVEGGDMSGFPAYFINQKMFACVHDSGVGIRLPVAAATELQFSKANIVPFQPRGKPSTREWVQINHENSADYEQDLELFRSSIEFVKAQRTR